MCSIANERRVPTWEWRRQYRNRDSLLREEKKRRENLIPMQFYAFSEMLHRWMKAGIGSSYQPPTTRRKCNYTKYSLQIRIAFTRTCQKINFHAHTATINSLVKMFRSAKCTSMRTKMINSHFCSDEINSIRWNFKFSTCCFSPSVTVALDFIVNIVVCGCC